MTATVADVSANESRKPKDSKFKQQRLPAWQPVMSAHTVLPVLFAVGIGFIPLGIGFLVSALNVQEVIVDYTTDGCEPNCGEQLKNETAFCEPNCKDYRPSCYCNVTLNVEKPFESQVYMYYGLEGYYQNLRLYVKSRDDYQLSGSVRTYKDIGKLCDPVRGILNFSGTGDQPFAPCGAIANSLFTDSFSLYYIRDDGTEVKVPLTSQGIAWGSDYYHKYKNTNNYNDSVGYEGQPAPPLWNKPVNEMIPGGYKNEDFMVWMRTAALPNFRKLYRRVVHSSDNTTSAGGLFAKGLPAGNYTVTVDYNYRVSAFKGKKKIILTTTSFLGGKNPFLGIAYIVVGSICFIAGLILLIIHLRVGKSQNPNKLVDSILSPEDDIKYTTVIQQVSLSAYSINPLSEQINEKTAF